MPDTMYGKDLSAAYGTGHRIRTKAGGGQTSPYPPSMIRVMPVHKVVYKITQNREQRMEVSCRRH